MHQGGVDEDINGRIYLCLIYKSWNSLISFQSLTRKYISLQIWLIYYKRQTETKLQTWRRLGPLDFETNEARSKWSKIQWSKRSNIIYHHFGRSECDARSQISPLLRNLLRNLCIAVWNCTYNCLVCNSLTKLTRRAYVMFITEVVDFLIWSSTISFTHFAIMMLTLVLGLLAVSDLKGSMWNHSLAMSRSPMECVFVYMWNEVILMY